MYEKYVSCCNCGLPIVVSARNTPFQVSVNFDENEVDNSGNPAGGASNNEQTGAPAGIVGFKLNFAQGSTNC